MSFVAIPSNVPSSGVPAMRNAGIDALRGLSILLVVFHHTALRMSLSKGILAAHLPPWVLSAVMYNGYEAVFVFFVLSGFLIAGGAIGRYGSLRAIDLRTFYARRFARIAPPLFVLVAVLSLLHLSGASDYRIAHEHQSLPGAVFSAFGLYLNWYEGQTGYLPGSWDVLWSLSIEEVFYLAFPVLCVLLRKNAVLGAVSALIALSLPLFVSALHGNEIWKEKAYAPGIAAIAMGVLAALFVASGAPPRRAIRTLLLVFGLCGIAAVLFVEDFLVSLLGNGTMLFLTASVASVVAALAFHERSGGSTVLPMTGWLRSQGRLSYEIYLTHMFVVLTAARLWNAAGLSMRYGVVAYVLVPLAAWALGLLVARHFAIPAERAVRRRFGVSEEG